jgi:hypothetical protein
MIHEYLFGPQPIELENLPNKNLTPKERLILGIRDEED